MWPGTFATFFPPKFSTLAQIDTPDGSGGVTSRTASSADWPLGCGSETYLGGTAALHQPTLGGPTWCIPEQSAVNPDPVPCSSDSSVAYGNLGEAIDAQLAADGRGQVFVSLPWDWRQSPDDAVAALQTLLEQVTAETGQRATVAAHSFGNLVYREWSRAASASGSPSDLVGRFVSVAGPWWGVATAWTHPAFGQIQPGLNGEALSRYEGLASTAEVFQTAPGPYWLLPNEDLTNEIAAELGGQSWLAAPEGTGHSRWVPFDQIGDVAADQFTLCPQSDTFPCQAQLLDDVAAAGQPASGFDTGGVEWVGIVGSGVATPGQICSDCVVFPDGSSDGVAGQPREDGPVQRWRIRTVNGDANVPYVSAIQGTDPLAPPGDHVPFYFTCGHTHMGLLQDAPILDRLVLYLTGDSDLAYDDVFSKEPCDVPPNPGPPTVPKFTG